MGKQATSGVSAASSEERIRALNRDTHEAAQELKSGLRDLAAFIEDLEESVASRVEKRVMLRLSEMRVELDRRKAALDKDIEETAQSIREMISQRASGRSFDDLLDKFLDELGTHMQASLLNAFQEKADALISEVLAKTLDDHLNALKLETITGKKSVIPGTARIVINTK